MTPGTRADEAIPAFASRIASGLGEAIDFTEITVDAEQAASTGIPLFVRK